jgi:hypothetical protein
MMEIDLALLADAATVDASGKLNILGVFDRISVPRFPVQHPHISLVLRFGAGMNEAGTHRVEILLADPDGATVVKMDGELKVGPGSPATGGRVRVPQIVNLERLPLKMPGQYSFNVSVDGEHHVSVPLQVHEVGKGRAGAQA